MTIRVAPRNLAQMVHVAEVCLLLELRNFELTVIIKKAGSVVMGRLTAVKDVNPTAMLMRSVGKTPNHLGRSVPSTPVAASMAL